MRSFNRTAVLTAVIVLALSVTCLAWTDGVYVGTAKGHNGPVTVEVAVQDGKITEIKVLNHSETPFISDADFSVINAIIDEQKTDVSTVTGATYTSKAVIEAVKNALGTWADGTYTGQGQGFKSTITVEVVVEDGKITAINILGQGETPFLSDAAFDAVPKAIIAAQSTDVDTVTGATGTSKGIIAAVKDALGN